jgi:hypothetical protein
MLLLDYFKLDAVELERLRIWDYYLAFPDEVSNIRFGVKPEDKEIKNLFPKKINIYNKINNPKKLFARMFPYQMIAIGKLAAYKIVKGDFEETGKVQVINKNKLKKLLRKINYELDAREQNVIKAMTTYFYYMSFYGESGLKSRTSLLEYKYDE